MMFVTLSKRAFLLLSAAVLSVAALLPLIITDTASGAQLTERYIQISTSEISQTGTTYFVSFKPNQTTNLRGIVVDICQNSPLIGLSCDRTRGVAATPTSGTINVAQTGATPASVTFAVHANSTANGLLILTHSTGFTTVLNNAPMTFSFTATNPTGTIATLGEPGTFFARILTYGDDDGNAGVGGGNGDSPSTYTSTTPGNHLDDGGVAMSTARQLSVTARVQERLEFCVAAVPGTLDGLLDADGVTADPAEVPDNCSASEFPTDTAISLGIVDSDRVNVSGDQTSAPQGNDKNGGIMIRTNAYYGAIVSYFAEQESASGQLKVAGSTCGGTSTLAGNINAVETDQCFNSAGPTEYNFRSSEVREKFGMTSSRVIRPAASTTTNLVRDTDYDGNGVVDNTADCAPATVDSANCFAWVDTLPATPQTAAERIAHSTSGTVKVLDYEMLIIKFAARSAPTTPTGTYTVTATFIATVTY